MIMEACAVYDKKIGAYMLPQFFRTKGEAVRAFSDAVASEGAPFSKHSEDYVFCRLGQYDDNSGSFKSLEVPEIIITADDCLVGRPLPPLVDVGPKPTNGKVAL